MKATMSKHHSQQQFDGKVGIGSYYGSDSNGRGQSSLLEIYIRGVKEPMDQFMVHVDDD